MPTYTNQIGDIGRSDERHHADGRVRSSAIAHWDVNTRQAYHRSWNYGYMPQTRASSLEYSNIITRWFSSHPGTEWQGSMSRTQVNLLTGEAITENYPGYGPITPDAPRPRRAPAGGDPYGRMPGEHGYNPSALPPRYAQGVCQCESCIGSYVRQNNITWERSGYTIARYVPPEEGSYRWTVTSFDYWGFGQTPVGHTAPPSRYAHLAEESPIPLGMLSLINDPLRFMLRRSGRVWSAEVEINNLDRRRAAEILGVGEVRYSERPDQSGIHASSDATVDAEIKVSCMRDGSKSHAASSLRAYQRLFDNGGRCHTNAGHHVHVDGTRLADMGTDAVEQVMTAAWTLGMACKDTLTALAASGYEQHRGQSQFNHHYTEGKSYLRGRAAIHSERLWYAANDGSDRVATVEYRLPNGTLMPMRAQAHISTALGILDFAERATVDGDEKAQEILRQVTDRVAHGGVYDERQGSELLLDALSFSRDAKRALAVSAFTAPMREDSKRIWEEAAEIHSPLAKLMPAEEAKAAKEPKAKKKPDTPARRRTVRPRIQQWMSDEAVATPLSVSSLQQAIITGTTATSNIWRTSPTISFNQAFGEAPAEEVAEEEAMLDTVDE